MVKISEISRNKSYPKNLVRRIANILNGNQSRFHCQWLYEKSLELRLDYLALKFENLERKKAEFSSRNTSSILSPSSKYANTVFQVFVLLSLAGAVNVFCIKMSLLTRPCKNECPNNYKYLVSSVNKNNICKQVGFESYIAVKPISVKTKLKNFTSHVLSRTMQTIFFKQPFALVTI